MEEKVVLVDEHDRELGVMDKLQAHREGRLHRAVSVFLVNPSGELLLQQRAKGKYHSPALWTNTCCTHPYPGESTAQASQRRLQEEMGLNVRLSPSFTTTYKLDVGAGLTEHELDHVYYGVTTVEPIPHPVEVMDWQFIAWGDLENRLKTSPHLYTAWFHRLFREARLLMENQP